VADEVLAAAAEKLPHLNKEKARRAARHPQRPGQKCGAEPGRYQPAVNRSACEGKRDCMEVCPFNVFEVRRIEDLDFAKLSLFGKLKSVVHGRLTAYTPQAELCRACGLCVVACPEDAIELMEIE
jgi:NAD-dependent dihydropyrimidine dehydrogenase PreA subunit